ncbi:MAG TPA: ABC transporter permease [Flavobacteriaceae bacterium]|nr:ABC transporter permease [Flavobacteriaceae bacterium]
MRNLKLIVKREYLAKVKNKTFVVMTFLSPLIMVGMIALIAYLTTLNNDVQRTVAVHDQGEVLETFQSSKSTKFIDYSNMSIKAAKDSVASNEFDGLLFIPKNLMENREVDVEKIVFFTKNSPDNSLLEQLETKISTEITNQRLLQNGVNLKKLAQSETRVSIKIENFSGQRSSKISLYLKMFFGGAAGYLLMMFIIIYGNMVMRSVIEEKTNRIVEIIVSSVKPIQLMLGKIIGTTLAGISQFMIWVILGGALMLVFSMVFGIDMSQTPQSQAVQTVSDAELQQLLLDVSRLPFLKLIGYFIVYFIGGYFLYSSIYAAIGAAVDNETDTQQFMFPIIIPLMLGIYVGFFAVIENPHGTVSTIFSMIPLTSPVVMLMRIPFGVPWWEIVVSIGILILSILGTVWLAAKIYKIGILMYGKKPTYKDLYKWIRY